MLVGMAILLPVILGYTVWVYWLFRGKVTAGCRLSLRPPEPPAESEKAPPLGRRLVWFFGLAAAGAAATAALAYALRAVLFSA